MPDSITIIKDFVLSVQSDIIKNQQAKGLRASGESAASLRIESPNANTVQLIDGSGAFKFQDQPGRPPTTGGASSIPLHQRIYDWLAFKKYNFNYATDKERKSLSYAIANKIHRQGNFIHRTGKTTGVVSDVITTSRIDEMKKQVGENYRNEYAQKIVTVFKRGI